MKAVEMRKKTIQPQYEAILAEIENELSNGNTLAASFKVIYPEVVEMLLDDGFDIEVAIDSDEKALSYAVSCVNAEEGRRGTLTKKRLPLVPPLPPLGEFMEMFFKGSDDRS